MKIKKIFVVIGLFIIGFVVGYKFSASSHQMTAHISASEYPLNELIKRIIRDIELGENALARKKLWALDTKIDRYLEDNGPTPEEFASEIVSIKNVDKSFGKEGKYQKVKSMVDKIGINRIYDDTKEMYSLSNIDANEFKQKYWPKSIERLKPLKVVKLLDGIYIIKEENEYGNAGLYLNFAQSSTIHWAKNDIHIIANFGNKIRWIRHVNGSGSSEF